LSEHFIIGQQLTTKPSNTYKLQTHQLVGPICCVWSVRTNWFLTMFSSIDDSQQVQSSRRRGTGVLNWTTEPLQSIW